MAWVGAVRRTASQSTTELGEGAKEYKNWVGAFNTPTHSQPRPQANRARSATPPALWLDRLQHLHPALGQQVQRESSPGGNEAARGAKLSENTQPNKSADNARRTRFDQAALLPLPRMSLRTLRHPNVSERP